MSTQQPTRKSTWENENSPHPEIPSGAAHPRGITLIEVMVVMIILALIATFVGTEMFSKLGEAKVSATIIQIRNLDGPLGLYRLDNSTYPTTEQGLDALLRRPEVGRIPQDWQGPYIKANRVPADGWGNDFIFVSDGRDFTILSLGADGQEGGIETDADISSKDL